MWLYQSYGKRLPGHQDESVQEHSLKHEACQKGIYIKEYAKSHKELEESIEFFSKGKK